MKTGNIILLLLLIGNIAIGQSILGGKESALLKVEKQLLKAYETNDAKVMNQLVAAGFVITFSDGGQQTKTELMKVVRDKAGTQSGVTFTTQNTKVSFYGKTTAVLRGTLITRWKDPSGGIPKEEQQLYTDTYVKLNGHWQIAASHLTTQKPN